MINATLENTTFENNTGNNTTTNPSASIINKAFISLYILILIIGVVGNITTCIVIAKTKIMRTPTNFYLFSLAISDMIFLILRVRFQLHILLLGKWTYSFLINYLYMITVESTTYATVLTTTAFTVERYFAICHPFFNRYAMSKLSRVVKYIIGIWVICVLLAIFPSWCVAYDFSHPKDMSLTYTNYVVASSVVLFFLIPFSLITVLYVLIGCALRKHTRERNITTNVSTQDRKAIRMLVTVVIAFFVCWTPYWIARLLNAFNVITSKKDKRLYDISWRYIIIVSLLSTIVNPFIYSIMSTNFRRAFRVIFIRSWYDKLLRNMRRRVHPEDSVHTSIEMSSSNA